MSGEFSAGLLDLVEAGGTALEGAAPYLAGGAAGIAGGLAASGGSAAAGTAATDSAASATGPTTSAAPGATSPSATASPNGPGFFSNAVKSALVGSAVNMGASALMGRRGGVTVPPPPGAAMIDPEGAQAAAQIRSRQAVAGGLSSTITPGANSQGAFDAATSGGKSLLGQ